MHINTRQKENCCGCGSCASICPQKCIQMKYDDEGFLYPIIDDSNCVDCGLCERLCPVEHNPFQKVEISEDFYAVKSNDDHILNLSSSGGVAQELSIEILQNHGAVFGASFNEDFSMVEHIKISELNELKKIQGSKYLQSRTDAVYTEIASALKMGQTVLFIGTPCQTAAVKNRFPKIKEIYLVDLICTAVPSKLLWDSFITQIKKKYGEQIQSINFRDKSLGWRNYGIKIEYGNNSTVFIPGEKGYLHLFRKCFSMRPSCENCKFKGLNRCSDLTIGDFWGIETVQTSLTDSDIQKGVSIVKVNSDKGNELLMRLSNRVFCEKVEVGDLFTKRNKTMLKPHAPSPRCEEFSKDLKKLKFSQIEKKYLSQSFIHRAKMKLKRMIVG